MNTSSFRRSMIAKITSAVKRGSNFDNGRSIVTGRGEKPHTLADMEKGAPWTVGKFDEWEPGPRGYVVKSEDWEPRPNIDWEEWNEEPQASINCIYRFDPTDKDSDCYLRAFVHRSGDTIESALVLHTADAVLSSTDPADREMLDKLLKYEVRGVNVGWERGLDNWLVHYLGLSLFDEAIPKIGQVFESHGESCDDMNSIATICLYHRPRGETRGWRHFIESDEFWPWAKKYAAKAKNDTEAESAPPTPTDGIDWSILNAGGQSRGPITSVSPQDDFVEGESGQDNDLDNDLDNEDGHEQ